MSVVNPYLRVVTIFMDLPYYHNYIINNPYLWILPKINHPQILPQIGSKTILDWYWVNHSSQFLAAGGKQVVSIPSNNVLLVKIEGPVWYTIYHHLPVVKGVSSNPSINQPTNGKRTSIEDLCFTEGVPFVFQVAYFVGEIPMLVSSHHIFRLAESRCLLHSWFVMPKFHVALSPHNCLIVQSQCLRIINHGSSHMFMVKPC